MSSLTGIILVRSIFMTKTCSKLCHCLLFSIIFHTIVGQTDILKSTIALIYSFSGRTLADYILKKFQFWSQT